MLHHETLTPHRAIWTLAVISAVIGCFAVTMIFGDAGALTDATVKALPQGFWSSFGYVSHDVMAAMPNTPAHHNPGIQLRHIPALHAELLHLYRGVSQPPQLQLLETHGHPGVRAAGEPGLHGVLSDRTVHGIRNQVGAVVALGIAAVWGIYGGIYFIRSSKSKGRTTLVNKRFMAAQ